MDSQDVPQIPQPFLDVRLLVVANANLTFKSSTTQALMWLTDLQSGQPMEGAPLTVYDKGFNPIGEALPMQTVCSS
jgi:uncharacterized protein YfaS (alpha-2-macroglobulin family)